MWSLKPHSSTRLWRKRVTLLFLTLKVPDLELANEPAPINNEQTVFRPYLDDMDFYLIHQLSVVFINPQLYTGSSNIAGTYCSVTENDIATALPYLIDRLLGFLYL